MLHEAFALILRGNQQARCNRMRQKHSAESSTFKPVFSTFDGLGYPAEMLCVHEKGGSRVMMAVGRIGKLLVNHYGPVETISTGIRQRTIISGCSECSERPRGVAEGEVVHDPIGQRQRVHDEAARLATLYER